MKKLLVLLCLLSASVSFVYAQGGTRTLGAQSLMLDDGNINDQRVFLTNSNGSLGINNTGVTSPLFPSQCALLDLSSTSKGFLPPRMTTAQELAICGGTPPEGMMVYNTTTHSFDMYNGSAWVPAGGGAAASTNWSLTGNGGTSPASNFLGTTDATDLVFKTSGTERVRMLSGGNIGIGDPSPASLLTVGNGDKFQVNTNGDVVALKGVTYSWPVANASGVLTNNGSGALSWAAPIVVSAWNLTGNNTTDPETNFLGTIDSKDLVVRTTNSERIRVLAGGNVGIGVQSPAALFSVGALSKFRVNSGGDITSIKGITYSWPSATATGVLTNDGAGNLTWSAAAAATSGWDLSGNAGTSAGSNFVGTTDDQPFEIHIYESDSKLKGSKRVMRFEPMDSSANIIGGYQDNIIYSYSVGSVIGGGGQDGAINQITGSYCVIGGGTSNIISSELGSRNSFIGAGWGNSVDGVAASVVGGLANTVSRSFAVIGGGMGNGIFGEASFIGAGGSTGESTAGNFIYGNSSAIGAGISNVIFNSDGFIGAGSNNTVENYYASVLGGNDNHANGYLTSISGGEQNYAIGQYSSIVGGSGNVTNGPYSVVGGGISNTVDGESAMVLGGNNASASQYGQFAQAAGSFGSQGDAQTSVFVARNTTNDSSTSTPLYIDGNSQKLLLPNNNMVYTFRVLITAINTTTAGQYAGYEVKGLIYRDNAGNVGFIGPAPIATTIANNLGGGSFTVAADNVNKALDLLVKGSIGQNIRWVARIETVETSFSFSN